MEYKINKYTWLRLVFAVLGIGFIIASMLGETRNNTFLCLGLVFTSIAYVVTNVEKKQRMADRQAEQEKENVSEAEETNEQENETENKA